MEQKSFLVLSCVFLSLSATFIEIEGASVGNANTAAASSPGAQQQTKVFSSSPSYVAHFTTDDSTIKIRIEAATKGWVGFGFSPDGTMNNAELIIAGVEDSGKPYFGVYHAVGHSPRKIESGDWKLLSASENATSTTVEFVRPITANGHEIQTGEINVIWAIGADDDTTQMHVHRGPAKITLLPNVGENIVDVHGRAFDDEDVEDDEDTEQWPTDTKRNSEGDDKKQTEKSNSTTGAGCPPCHKEEDESWWSYNSSPRSSSMPASAFVSICISLVAAIFLK